MGVVTHAAGSAFFENLGSQIFKSHYFREHLSAKLPWHLSAATNIETLY